MDTANQRATQACDDDHAEALDGATSGAAPLDTPSETKRGRGRPRKPKPSKASFDDSVHSSTIASIKAIPANWRNSVRDEAIFRVTRLPSASASAKVIFGRVAMELRWAEGWCLYSNQWFANQCTVSKRTVERAFEAFRDVGWVSRRERVTKAGDYQTCETTIPLFAQVWAEMQAQQTAERVPHEKSGVPTGKENTAEGVPTENPMVSTRSSYLLSVGTDTGGGQPSVLSQQQEKESDIIPSLCNDSPNDDQIQVQPLSPGRVTLGGWKGSTPFFREHDFAHHGPVEDVWDLERWRQILHQYGGAPLHVTTPAAHQQALEIGHELSAQAAVGGEPVPVDHAMLALAAMICSAHAQKKPFRSLGFIVDPLARRARHGGDPTWAYNLPRRRDSVSEEEFEAAFELAQKACYALETWEQLSVDRNRLLGTWEVECLAESIKHFGRHALVDAIDYVNDRGVWAGRLLDSWRCFDREVESAKAAKAAAVAPPAPAEARPASEADVVQLGRINEILLRQDLTANEKCASVGGVLEAAKATQAPAVSAPAQLASPSKQPRQHRPLDSIPTTLTEADGLGILAPDLAQYGGQELRTFVAEQAAHHQCTQDEILDSLAAILRGVTSGAYGSRREAAQAIVRPTSGPPRSHISRWCYFGHVLALEREQRKMKEEAC